MKVAKNKSKEDKLKVLDKASVHMWRKYSMDNVFYSIVQKYKLKRIFLDEIG